jgi:hypothetical protein
MHINIRRKLDMARRARDFCRTHPGQNPGHTAAIQRLEELVARAEALAQQQLAGRLAVSNAVLNKEQLRQEIHETFGLLMGLSHVAAREKPDLAVVARPRTKLSYGAYLTRARVVANTCATHRALLTRYGMPDDLPTHLGAALDGLEQALQEKHAGRTAHVGARAELEAVMADIMLLVGRLDALNQICFRNNAEALAAWESARDVAWPMKDGKDGKDGKVRKDGKDGKVADRTEKTVAAA